MPYTQADYPAQVVTKIRGAWPAWLGVDPTEALPSDDVLLALVDVAYQASLRTEEGRGLSFRIAYGDPNEFEDEHGRTFPAAVRFEHPRPFNAGEVMRLAPASDPTRLMIGVRGNAEHLEVWGLADIGAGRYRQLQGDLTNTTPPDTPVVPIITVFRPGELQASFGDIPLVELAAGAVRSAWTTKSISVFAKGPVASVFAIAQDRLLNDIRQLEYDPPLIIEEVMQEFGICFERLLLEISGKRHGGAIVVVPNGQIADVTAQLLNIKYRCDDGRLW